MGEYIERPVEEVLAGMDIIAAYREGGLIADAVVILKVLPENADDPVAIVVANTPSMDWIAQMGMLHAALYVANQHDPDEDGYEL